MNETWKPVVGYEGLYEVSDLGRVKSLEKFVVRSNGAHYTRKERIRKPYPDKDGYPKLCLSHRGKSTMRSVHSLVMEAFVGKCPDGMEICHNDSNPSNPSLSNLRYDTRSGNQADRVLNGTRHIGETHPCSKLSTDDVIVIKIMGLMGFFQKTIAKQFNINQVNVSAILTGKIWKHIQLIN